MPVIESTVDLGVTVVNDLSPCDHIKNIVAKAHMRSNAIHHCSVSRDKWFLVHAYLVYVRPLLEYNSIVCSPHLKQGVVLTEKVQRRFTKKLWKLRHCFLS